MKTMRWSVLLTALLSAASAFPGAVPAAAEEYYHAYEINGTLCGYVKFTTSPLVEDGMDLILLEHVILIQVRAVGRSGDAAAGGPLTRLRPGLYDDLLSPSASPMAMPKMIPAPTSILPISDLLSCGLMSISVC